MSDFKTDPASDSPQASVPDVDIVTRVVLPHSPRSTYSSGSTLRLEAFLSTEFNEAVPGLLRRLQCVLRARWHECRDFDDSGAASFPSTSLSASSSGSGSSGSSGGGSTEEALYLASTHPKAGADVVSITGPAPAPGYWHLCVACEHILPSEAAPAPAAIVLDYWSDRITITPADAGAGLPAPPTAVRGFSLGGAIAMPLLANYRVLPGLLGRESTPLVLREEYGSSMGGHLYDSAVVLVSHWARVWGAVSAAARAPVAVATATAEAATVSAPAGVGVCLELGTGCGLVGIWLALHCKGRFKRVLLSDKEIMRTAVEANVASNRFRYRQGSGSGGNTDGELRARTGVDTTEAEGAETETEAEFVALEWTDERQVDTVLQHPVFRSEPLQLIVAADVLYGEEVSGAFLLVLRNLLRKYKEMCGNRSSPSSSGTSGTPPPTILVAQKIRSDAPLDLSSLPDFRVQLLLEAHSVRIWSLQCTE